LTLYKLNCGGCDASVNENEFISARNGPVFQI
jgi:hypothetical protein